MLKVSGMVIMVRKAGMATSGSSQAISPTTDSIMLPTIISAGAVAAAGMAPTTGAIKSASTKSNPVTMAVTPVRPPAATPAALSM